MKRIILILWLALVSSGWLMANHWTPNSMFYEDNMTLTGIVRIDGAEQQTTALEVGAFFGEECRGSSQLTYFSPTQHYVVQILIYGNIGDQITFRLYDHGQNEELDLISYDIVTITSDGYGSLANPYMLNFYSEPPGPYVVTVVADPEVGGVVTGGGTYNHGATATLIATANEDYRFVNWTRDGEEVSDSATFSFAVTEAGDYVAHFELSITHHWIPNAMLYEDNMTLTGVIQINGQEQQNPMLEVGVFCGEECRGSGVSAFFEPTQRYVVQALIFGESGDQLTFRLYDHELNEELELYPTHAVTFTTNGCGSLVNPHVLNFTEATTEIHTVEAIVNLEGSGTIMGTGTYLNGTTCTLMATANEGYQFINWKENGTMVSASTSYAFEVTSDRSFVASFVPIEGNHWTPNAAPYEDNMTLTGVVQVNFVEQQTTALEVGMFSGEECRGTGRLAFFSPTQRYVVQLVVYGDNGDSLTCKLYDHVHGEELDLVSPDVIIFSSDGYGSLQNPYVLNFKETYDITAIANPEEFGTVSGAGIYVYGTTATLTAMPNEGYHLVNWTRDGVEVSTSEIYSFTVTEAGDYVANFELSEITQTTTLSQGYNWWSTYIEQEGINGLEMLQESLGSNGVTIRSQASGYTDYYEGYGWYGSLSSIDNEHSYRVSTSALCTVTMTGYEAVPSQHPITLSPGWTWIGYVPSTAMNVNTAMVGIEAVSGDKLKSQHGYSDYYEGYGWFGSLNTIEPGMGLMYYSNNSQSVTLTYPDNSKGGELKANMTAENNHWVPNVNAYPENMTVTAIIELDGIELQSEHYELAAFVNSECRGSSRLMYVAPLNRYIAFLTIVGDDAVNLSFGLYDTETGMEYFDTEDNLRYLSNAIAGNLETPHTINFRGIKGVDEFGGGINVFPNPAFKGEELHIILSTEDQGKVRVEIVNTMGVLVETVCAPFVQTITSPNVAGVYTLRITVEGKGVFSRKLVVR